MNDGEKGQLDLRAEAENSADAAIRAVLGEVAPAPMLPGLVDDQPDDLDVLGRVAETLNAKRRARGRPEGSANRRNDEMFDYLEARGFKAPELRLMEIISADPVELARAIAQSAAYGPVWAPPIDLIMQIISMQAKAAGELMPYKFAKKHEVKHDISAKVAHVMMAGRLVAPGQGAVKQWSLTGEDVGIANEINGSEIHSHRPTVS
jgi:hypothetical protein